jgi:hypothetical protein
MLSGYYNLKNIRLLLSEGFGRDELVELCFDEPLLRDVYENWSEEASKGEFVRHIIDHAHKHLAMEVILEWAAKQNPSRYEAHRPYRQGDELEGAGGGEADLSGAGLVLENNDLGRGLTLGGAYRDILLRIVATDWAEYGTFGWVRSGWLFIPQWTTSHAVAFFKVHVSEDGEGYIHIVDVADPRHPIWLTTTTGWRKEKEFHYVGHPVDVWFFTWEGAEN